MNFLNRYIKCCCITSLNNEDEIIDENIYDIKKKDKNNNIKKIMSNIRNRINEKK